MKTPTIAQPCKFCATPAECAKRGCCADVAYEAELRRPDASAEPGLEMTCRLSNRSDCALFSTSRKERPSKEWYAQMIQETDGLDSALPCGALALPDQRAPGAESASADQIEYEWTKHGIHPSTRHGAKVSELLNRRLQRCTKNGAPAYWGTNEQLAALIREAQEALRNDTI